MQAKTAEGWRLTFHLSGGFAGMDRELQIASTGDLTARDRRRGTSIAAKAPANDLILIDALVTDMKSVDSGRSTSCRDCLQYDLEVQRRGETRGLRLDDMTLAKSGTGPLIKALTNLLDRALTGGLSLQGPAK
jgi:hypothetical protein